MRRREGKLEVWGREVWRAKKGKARMVGRGA